MASAVEQTASQAGGEGTFFVGAASFGTLPTVVPAFDSVLATASLTGFGGDNRMVRGLGLGAVSIALSELFVALTFHNSGDTCLAGISGLVVLTLPRLDRPLLGMIASSSGAEDTGEIGSCFRAFAACTRTGKRRRRQMCTVCGVVCTHNTTTRRSSRGNQYSGRALRPGIDNFDEVAKNRRRKRRRDAYLRPVNDVREGFRGGKVPMVEGEYLGSR